MESSLRRSLAEEKFLEEGSDEISSGNTTHKQLKYLS